MNKLSVSIKKSDWGRASFALQALFGVRAIDNRDVFLEDTVPDIITVDVYYYNDDADKLASTWLKVAKEYNIWTKVSNF